MDTLFILLEALKFRTDKPMIRNSIIYCLAVICCLLMANSLVAQDVSHKELAQKVIVDGKTFYLHAVKKGEGFYGIAKKYGVSQKEIHEANPKSIFGLKPGDILYIPVIRGRNSSSVEIEKSGEFVYHTIQKGQTLYYLSNKYGVTYDDIKKHNAGAEGDLLIGTIFKIPVKKQKVTEKAGKGFAYHVVKSKETLYGISKKYGAPIDTIIKYNMALQSGILSVGSKIRIPVVEKFGVKDVKKEEKALVIEDKEFVYHRIQQGETLYSIGKKYHVSQRDLEESNADLDPADLPLGFVVRVPKNKVVKQQRVHENDFVQHSVKRKETLYSISKKYGVGIADIEAANPTKILSNVKKGTKIKIPTQAYLVRIQEEKRQEELALQKAELVEKDTVGIDFNCGSYNYYVQKPVVKVALMLPFDIESTRKTNLIKKMEGEEEVEIPREDPILSPRSRTFVEFYEGALMALDSMKKQGVNVQLFTYDTAPDTNKVKQILARPELTSVDIIIGPAFASNLNLISDFSLKHKIKMVYPLSSVNPCLNKNPFLFQVNAPDTLLYDRYADYIVNQHDGARILVLKSSDPTVNENELAEKIKSELYLDYLPKGEVPDFVEINFSQQNVQGVEALLSKEKKNVVVIPSPEEADVSKIITTLHGVSESTEVDVKLIGFGNWLRFQTINAEEVHDLDTQILTTYVLDHNDPQVGEFSAKFRSWYNTEPFAVSPYFIRSGRNANYSRYGIWGFDVTYYFVGALIKYGHQFEHCLTNYRTKQVQFNFNFKRNVNWGGFYNEGLHVISFSPSLDIHRKSLN